MEWSDSLSIGVEAVDNQHKELIKRANGFFEVMKTGGGKDQVLQVLDFLSGYVVKHFRDEEMIQIRYRYPGYEAHRKMHQDFVEDVKRLRAELEQNGVTVASSSMVALTLSNWLVTHITMQDRLIGKHVKSLQG